MRNATQERALLQPRIEEFLTYCRARNLSKNTIRGYRADLVEFVAYCGGPETPISQVNRKLLRGFLVRLYEDGIKDTSTRRKLAAVKSFCKWIEAEGLMDAGLIESLPGPRKRDALPNVPSEDEVKQLLDGDIATASPQRDRVILELLYGSGLRASELIGINIDDFRDNDALVVRGKGKKERYAIFGDPARAALDAWLPIRTKLLGQLKMDTPALLFSIGPRRSVERLDVRSIGRILKEVAKSRGLDAEKWHPHLLRHACGTHFHDRGASLQAVAGLLGHTKLSTTQIYTRVSVGRMMDVHRRAHPHA